jgi:hypothetical protein
MKYLKTLGWEQIEGARFIFSAAEEEERKQVQDLLVSAGFDRGILNRSNKLIEKVTALLRDLISKGAPIWLAFLPILTGQHRLLATRQKIDSLLKQLHPDADEALAKLRKLYPDQPERLRKIAAHVSRTHYFPFDLLNMVPLVAHLRSIQRIAGNIGHYSIANEMDTLDKMKSEVVKWLTDNVEAYEQEAHTQITETKFYEFFERYLSDNIQEKMKTDTRLRNAMAKWETDMDQIGALAVQIASSRGLSLSTSREELLELKNVCASALVDENLRSRVENLLAERENYLGKLEDWPTLRSAQVCDLSTDNP